MSQISNSDYLESYNNNIIFNLMNISVFKKEKKLDQECSTINGSSNKKDLFD